MHGVPRGGAQRRDPEEKVFVEQYLKPGKPIPWRIYSKQPPCVFFSHAAHLNSAGLECVKCHGDHGQTETLRPYEENRLTGYSRISGVRISWAWVTPQTG